MDRKLISHIIRGKKVKFWNTKYDFSKIAALQRIQAANYSLPVKEIETNYDELDGSFGGPSANTTDFRKPIEAAVFLIKDLSKRMSHEDLSQSLSCLKWNIAFQKFSYDPEDWLTESENMQVNQSEDFRSAWGKARYLAFGRIFVFFDELTTIIKPMNQNIGSNSSYYTLAFLSIVILSSLLRDNQTGSNFDENISIFLKSNNWVIRAAAYSALLNNIPIDEKSWSEFTNFLDQAKKDPDASTHGIKLSHTYYLYKHIHDEAPFNRAAIHLDLHFKNLNIEGVINRYFDQLGYIFDKYEGKNDISAYINEHNRQVIRKETREEGRSSFLKKIKNRFGI
jgi:hypothetical protein